ncbi:serine/arginine repetitive matrix protein 2-like [Benincasa hispida]|uniref:serine/arginine repetitive matrix protein 2-like n=1 Tax=Benincasa hispida TaxID=102211 RepID=UPI001900582C|nr:serine/arginine repetitive matrix protein 2-like [Benincasa hispida]
MATSRPISSLSPKTRKVAESSRGFEEYQGIAGVSRKPNEDILEHDVKRWIELKLVILEDKLTDQGYTVDKISEKLREVRETLEAALEEKDGASAIVFADKSLSNTQTHRIAARKEGSR